MQSQEYCSAKRLNTIKIIITLLRKNSATVEGGYTINKEKDIVYIGNKPQMNYVLAVITQFNEGHASEVVLKARGRAISRTVDVAEIVKNKFITDVRIEDIRTDTEEITREDGSTSNVSAIEITLRK